MPQAVSKEQALFRSKCLVENVLACKNYLALLTANIKASRVDWSVREMKTVMLKKLAKKILKV